MALASYAWGYDGGTYNGKDMRQLVEAMFPAPASGVVTGLTVAQESSPTSTVSVAAGKAIVQATGSGLTGAYHAWNDAALSSPTIDPTTTNGRKDRLILRVSSGVPALEVVKGTAAASPAEPSITGDNYVELALITLPSSTSNVTNAMITDRRAFASALRAPIVCTSATRPTGIIEGQTIYETDTDAELFYDGTTWKRAGAHLPHSDIAYVVPASTRSTSSTTYTNWSTDTVQIASFVKYRADSILIIEACVTNWWGDGAMNYTIAAQVNGTDYELASMSFASGFGNFNLQGWNKVTGLAAGTYTIVFRHKVSASTQRSDTTTRVLLKATETLDKG